MNSRYRSVLRRTHTEGASGKVQDMSLSSEASQALVSQLIIHSNRKIEFLRKREKGECRFFTQKAIARAVVLEVSLLKEVIFFD